MKKAMVIVLLATSFGLYAMENPNFQKIAESMQKQIEKRLAQGEIKDHTLVPNTKPVDFNAALSKHEKDETIHSFRDQHDEIALALTDDDINILFKRAAVQIRERLNYPNKKYPKGDYEKLLKRGVDTFFKEKEVNLSDFFKRSPRLIFTTHDQKPIFSVMMNHAGNDFIINTNVKALNAFIQKVDKVTISPSEKDLTNSAMEKQTENVIKALSNVFNSKPPIVLKIDDNNITKFFGQETSTLIHARIKALKNKIDGVKVQEKFLTQIDNKHILPMQTGLLTCVLGSQPPKKFNEIKEYHTKLFATCEQVILTTQAGLPIVRAYKADASKPEIDDNIMFDFDLVGIKADLDGIVIKVNVGQSQPAVHTCTQPGDKSPKAEQ